MISEADGIKRVCHAASSVVMATVSIRCHGFRKAPACWGHLGEWENTISIVGQAKQPNSTIEGTYKMGFSLNGKSSKNISRTVIPS